MKDKGRIIYGTIFLITIPVVAFFVGKEIYSGKSVSATDIIKNLPETNTSETPKAATAAQASASPVPTPAQTPLPVQPQAQSPPTSAPETAPNTDAPKTDTSENSDDSATADHNTYKNDTLGISFDYPKEYAIALENKNTLNISNGNAYWKIKFYNDKNKEDIQTWHEDYFDASDNAGCDFLEPVIKAGSYEGKSVKINAAGGKCKDDGNFAISSDKIKIIRISLGKDTLDNVNKILSSFKFL